MFSVRVSLQKFAPASSESTLAEDSTSLPGVTVEHGAAVARIARDQVVVVVATCRSQAPHAIAESIATQYAARGVDAITEIPLEHAVLIVDARARHVVAATDRFGSVPICYRLDQHVAVFSDRADAVLDDDRSVEPQALLDYFFHHVIPSPRTVFKTVRKLAAASRLVFAGGDAKIARWWTPTFTTSPAPFATLRAEFLGILDAAVARRTQGRYGCFLSGGTDSSTVAGVIRKVTGMPAESYSIGFDAAGYDEMGYARIAARAFGTRHHEYYVTPSDLLEAIPAIARHFDQPFGNSSAAAAYLCARRASEDGIDLLLAGDGGDELFGGNERYALQRLFGLYETVPAPLGRLLEAIFVRTPLRRAPLVRKIGGYIEQARLPMPARMHHYNLLYRLGIENVFDSSVLAQVAPPQLEHEAAQSFANASRKTDSLVDRMLAYDWKYTLEDNDLPKVVGSAAAAGVGVTFPLLDDALVDFSCRLAPQMKLKGLRLRWFFKEALRGFLPDEIISKKKHGFGLPFGVWTTQHRGLRELAFDSLASLKARRIVRPEFIDELLSVRMQEHPAYYGEAVWILMMLEQWFGRQTNTAENVTSTAFTVA